MRTRTHVRFQPPREEVEGDASHVLNKLSVGGLCNLIGPVDRNARNFNSDGYSNTQSIDIRHVIVKFQVTYISHTNLKRN